MWYTVCLATGEESLQQKARKLSIQDVSNFLASIKLDQYITNFEEFEISGDVLLDINSANLLELGVDSALDRLRILVGFRRHLEGGGVRFTTSQLTVALVQNNLAKYRKLFEEHRVDGDMLLYEEEDLVRSMLQEIGVTFGVDITRIISKFKTFASIR